MKKPNKRVDLFSREGGHENARKIALGDRGAENDFYKYYYGNILHYINSRFKVDKMTAEDLTIMALTKSMKAIKEGRYKPDFKVSTWVYIVARNLTIDHIKTKESKTQKIHIEKADYDFQISTKEKSFLDKIIQEDQDSLVRKAINRLPAIYRIIIFYRYIKDYSYLDCARILGKPLGTIKGQIYRAKFEMLKRPEIQEILKERKAA